MHPVELKNQVKSLKLKGKSLQQIATQLNMPRSTVQKMIKPEYIKIHPTPGRPRKITQQLKKSIKYYCKKLSSQSERVTASKLKNLMKPDCSISTIQRGLLETGKSYKNICQKILLTNIQKENRVKCVEKWLSSGIKFSSVIFTDEKKFNYDGPDNHLTWSDANSNPRVKRQQGGPSIMVYGAVTNNGDLHLVRINDKLNSERYQELIRNVLPWFREKDSNFILMQDNAPCHRSKATKKFFMEANIKLLDWPAYSPDMNPIENIWNMMASKVYDGCQFNNKDNLWTKVQDVGVLLNRDFKENIMNMVQGFPNRIIKLIKNDGDIIN